MWQDWGDTDQEPEEEPVRISLEGLWQKVAQSYAWSSNRRTARLGTPRSSSSSIWFKRCAVPLGYDFRLYTYGPFASEVLDDLETAQSFQSAPHQNHSLSLWLRL